MGLRGSGEGDRGRGPRWFGKPVSDGGGEWRGTGARGLPTPLGCLLMGELLGGLTTLGGPYGLAGCIDVWASWLDSSSPWQSGPGART